MPTYATFKRLNGDNCRMTNRRLRFSPPVLVLTVFLITAHVFRATGERETVNQDKTAKPQRHLPPPLSRPISGVLPMTATGEAKPCDLNLDGQCDSKDFVLLMTSLGRCIGEAGYDPIGDIDGDGCVTLSDIQMVASPKRIGIDVKPGSFPNSVNLKAKGNVPVAILSDATFDGTTVDRRTVVFVGAPALAIGGGSEDVNGDGRPDVVLHFAASALLLKLDSTEVCLGGVTVGGQKILGCDSVLIVK